MRLTTGLALMSFAGPTPTMGHRSLRAASRTRPTTAISQVAHLPRFPGHCAGRRVGCRYDVTSSLPGAGEVPWVRRNIKAYHAEAEEKGVKLVHCCGFDSVPFDLGVHMVAKEMEAQGKCGQHSVAALGPYIAFSSLMHHNKSAGLGRKATAARDAWGVAELRLLQEAGLRVDADGQEPGRGLRRHHRVWLCHVGVPRG